jgi:twitching motility two-component system response regulator PilG
MMMSHTLRKMGCEVECAEDGYKALGMLRRFKPDLIFLDITMPELDGYQTCTLIRNSEDTRNTPVVMLSSSDGIFDIAKGRARGATAHVTKIPPESVLRELIYNHTLRQAAA